MLGLVLGSLSDLCEMALSRRHISRIKGLLLPGRCNSLLLLLSCGMISIILLLLHDHFYTYDILVSSGLSHTKIHDKVNIKSTGDCFQNYQSSEHFNLSGHAIPRLSYKGLPRSLTDEEYHQTQDLVRDVDKLFTGNNMSYTLSHWTLLGSYLMHDMLPWDDDVDIWTGIENLSKIVDIFYKKRYPRMVADLRHFRSFTVLKLYHKTGEPVNKNHLYNICTTSAQRLRRWSNIVQMLYKCFVFVGKVVSHSGLTPWRWPYVDVLFLLENNTHLETTMVKTHTVIDKKDFYPITRRPFMSMWLPAPYSPISMLSLAYSIDREFTGDWWSHKEEKNQHIFEVPVDSVLPFYPVVRRIMCTNSDMVQESLYLNKTKMYSVLVRQSPGPLNELYKQWYPFSWFYYYWYPLS